MSLQLLVVHNGQRLTVDHASFTNLETLKAWISEATKIPSGKQILLTPAGKQARAQALKVEVNV